MSVSAPAPAPAPAPALATETSVRVAPNPSVWERAPLLWALFIGSALLLLWQLGGYGLIDVDEGRYAEVAHEMWASGDWITPRLNYIAFFDKPPLLYWSIAAFYHIFGVSEWAARAVSALWALVGIGAAYGLGRRIFGARAGFLSALITLTCLEWTILARLVLTDMLVSSLVFCAGCAWWLALSEREVGAAANWRKRGFLAAFWIGLGLGMLAKGPVVLVLCGGSIFFYLLLTKRWRDAREMGWLWGVPLLIVVAAPWFVAVALRNPEFNRAFWYEQNVGRFLGDTANHDHAQGPLYFLTFLPAIVFPWSFYALPALFYGAKRLWPANTEARCGALFLLVSAGWIMLFFSKSESKLVTYILPLVPPFAVLMAAYFDRLLNRNNAPFALACAAILGGLLAIGGAVAWVMAPARLDPMGASDLVVRGAASALFGWGVALILAVSQRNLSAVIGATAVGWALCFAVGITLVSEIMPGITTKPLVAKIENGLKPQTEILAVGFTQSLPFYTGKRMRVMGTPDELAYGKAHLSEAERARWFFEIAPDLRGLMLRPNPVYCVVRLNNDQENQVARALQNTAGQVFEIARNDRFLIIGNAAAAQLTPPMPGQTPFDRARQSAVQPNPKPEPTHPHFN